MCQHCFRYWKLNGEIISLRALGKKGKPGTAVAYLKEYLISMWSGTASSEEGTDDKRPE